ncbi:MAG: tetratricopeptide repeat protein [Bacteroidales bacterium]|jgi:hypothetical protein|nr:tetratricopeptide repeat protein [Bacteroidales bacterium]
MNDDELFGFIKKTVDLVHTSLNQGDLKMVDGIVSEFKPTDSTSLADVASGLWISASQAAGLYLMGRAALDDRDRNTLNNYAAFMEMAGRPDLALPVLLRLNSDVPNHSTILNNIGQAWFRLGDIAKSSKYLDSAVAIYPTHPQANLTLAAIAANQGNKTKTIDCLRKSISEAFTPEKQAMLEQLGYTLTKQDITRRTHMPEDPLGFDRWLALLPPWPQESVELRELIPVWTDFFRMINEEENNLRQDLAALSKELVDQIDLSRKTLKPVHASDTRPFNLTPKMSMILKLYAEDDDESGAYETDYYTYTGDWWTQGITMIQTTLAKKMIEIQNAGGYISDPEKCPAILAAHNKAIADMSEISQQYFWAIMNYEKRRIANRAYVAANSGNNPLTSELGVIQAKLDFLLIFSMNLRPTVPSSGNLPPEHCKVLESRDAQNKLAVWEDTHCEEISMTMPLIGKWSIKCGIGEFHLDPFMLPFDFHYKENLRTNEWISCSGSVKLAIAKGGGEYNFTEEKGKLEIGVSGKLGEGMLKGSPIKAGVDAVGFIEIDGNGISDLGVKGSVNVKPNVGELYKNDMAKVEMKPGKVELTGKVSWNSGPSGDLKAEFHPAFSNFSSTK